MHFSACCGVKFGIRSHESLVSKPEDVQRPAILSTSMNQERVFWIFSWYLKIFVRDFCKSSLCFFVYQKPDNLGYEAIVSVSHDKRRWYELEFPCKPGRLDRRPCMCAPYHYRLDWRFGCKVWGFKVFHLSVISRVQQG